MSLRGAGCALAAALLAAGCGGREAAPYPKAPVVLVSIDTLRADRLPAYGYTKGSTPNIDRLAAEGVLFERVVSPCPLTLPAHASMLTGLLPPRHGVRDNLGFRLDTDRSTLASRFKAVGRATGGAVSAFVLRSATGIAQGFDLYDDAITVDASVASLGAQQRDGAVAVEALGRFVEAHASEPFFAFLHLYEPHTPYSPPPPHRLHPDPYDGEVAYADELLGRLVARLKSIGVYDRTILALTSDHGEGLGDHGEKEHGFFLYREVVEIPLVLRLPGGERGGTRVKAAAALVDLPVTLLDLAGLPAEGLDGRSLRAALTSGTLAPRPAYAETLYPRLHFGWSELFSLTDDRFRFILAPRPELYDIANDHGERRNLAAERDEVVARMSQWIREKAGPGGLPTPEPVAPEVEEALRALGYVGGGRGLAAAPAAGDAAADPKDKIGVYEDYRAAAGLLATGRDADAVEALRSIVARESGMLDAWESLGGALLRVGLEREGIKALDRALQRDPGRASAHLALARAHALAGRVDLATKHAIAASANEPGRAFETLAEVLMAQGRPPEAAEYARRSLAADPQRAVSHFILGLVARRAGRCQEAVRAFTAAEEARLRQRSLVIPGLHAGRGDCLARLGRVEEAEAAFRAEIAEFPFSREGRVGLALLLRSQGRDREAREALAGIVTAHPRPGTDEYWVVVKTLAGLGDQEAADEWAARARQRFPKDARFRAPRGR